MRRDVSWLTAMAIGFLGATALAQAEVSLAQDARKICLERYEVEKAGGTLPAGFSKTRYVNQCTLSIIQNAKLEAALKASAGDRTAPGATQNPAGENELTPKQGDAPKQTTSRPRN